MKYTIWILTIILASCSSEPGASEWASLQRYSKENEQLKARSPAGPRVVFMGNSIIETWQYVEGGMFRHPHYINRGIGGQTTSQMLLRFRQDVIELQPLAVVILAGTNDIAENAGPISPEQVAGNIFSMAELARAHNIEPILCAVLPTKQYYWRRHIQPATIIQKLNELIRHYCTENKIEFLDYYTPLVDESLGLKESLTPDGVHLHRDGYIILESLTVPVIENVMRKHSPGTKSD